MDHSHTVMCKLLNTHKAHAAAKRIYRKGEKRICQSVLRDGDRKKTGSHHQSWKFFLLSITAASQPAVLQYTTDREDWNFRKQINQNFFGVSSIFYTFARNIIRIRYIYRAPSFNWNRAVKHIVCTSRFLYIYI